MWKIQNLREWKYAVFFGNAHQQMSGPLPSTENFTTPPAPNLIHLIWITITHCKLHQMILPSNGIHICCNLDNICLSHFQEFIFNGNQWEHLWKCFGWNYGDHYKDDQRKLTSNSALLSLESSFLCLKSQYSDPYWESEKSLVNCNWILSGKLSAHEQSMNSTINFRFIDSCHHSCPCFYYYQKGEQFCLDDSYTWWQYHPRLASRGVFYPGIWRHLGKEE